MHDSLIHMALEALDGNSGPQHGPNPKMVSSLLQENLLKTVLQSQMEIKKRKSKKITFSKPILWWNNTPIIFPYTINSIQGQKGVHKSRLAEILISTLLSETGEIPHSLGFKADLKKEVAICYVDTERNLKEEFPYAIQAIQKKAGIPIEEDPENLHYGSLMGISRENRFQALEQFVDYLRWKTDRHLFIVLDVLTDCISDFNRADQSMELIDLMNQTINSSEATFLCIIHENPGSMKARGHLGTELGNKASTQLQIAFEKDKNQNPTDLIKIKFLKCRKTARPEPLHVVYDEDAKGLVLAKEDCVLTIVHNRRKKAHIEDVAEEIERIYQNTPFKGRLLIEQLSSLFQTNEKTIRERLKEIELTQRGIRNKEGIECHLVKYQEGKEKFYELRPIIEDVGNGKLPL